ncbi:MAG TPA: MFS transporter, partial [Geobacteraceae bacterium]
MAVKPRRMRSFTDEADEQPRHGLPSFLSLNFLCGCATGILQLAIPLYAISLRASTVQLGLIAGVSGVGRMLIIVPSGLLVDRFGARTLFLHSTVWCVVLVIAMSLVSSPWALMGIMFFQGMAQSVSFLSLQAGFL